MKKKDHLFDLFLKRLNNYDDIDETHNDFIKNVTNEFFLKIGETGHIPGDFREGVLEDIEHEVIEMYCKKTYGCMTLKEFRQKTQRKSA